MHGLGVYMYVADEGTPGGANWCFETVSRLRLLTLDPCLEVMNAIDSAFVRLRAEGRSLPAEWHA